MNWSSVAVAQTAESAVSRVANPQAFRPSQPFNPCPRRRLAVGETAGWATCATIDRLMRRGLSYRNTRTIGRSFAALKSRFHIAQLLLVLSAFSVFRGLPPCLGQTANATIAFSDSIYYEFEDRGPATIKVTRSGITNTAVTVRYATGKGLATAGVDYTAQSGTLSFASGETTKTFSIPFHDDGTPEGSETVEITLSNPSGGAVLGPLATARLYIQDNENRGTLLDDTFQGAIQPGDSVNAIALQPDGKVLVVGAFARAGSTNVDRVIRLHPDGRRDASFATADGGPNNSVYNLALRLDGKIVIGGRFTQIGSTARNRVARLNTDGSLDLSFDPGLGPEGSTSPGVYSIVLLADGKALIGGNFESVNGVARVVLARLNPDGSLDTAFPPGSGISSTDTSFRFPWVSAVVIQPNGKILIGGQFTDVDGLSRRNIARLNADGSVDAGFDPGSGPMGSFASVEAVALQTDGKVVIGGDFATVNDVPRKSLARLNSDGTVDTSFDPGTGVEDTDSDGAEITGYVTSLAVQGDGKILFGGTFLTVDKINRHGVARINPDGSLDGTFGPYSGTTYRNESGYEETESISAMALQPDGKVLIGATFVSADGSLTNRLTRLLSTNVRAPSVEFSSPGITAGETDGSLPLTVMRRGVSDATITVEYSTASGTATAGLDFTPQSGVLRFGPLEVEKTVSIPILEDGVLENDETLDVDLRNPSAGASLGAPAKFAIRIIDARKPGNLDFSFARVDIPFPDDFVSNLPVTAIVIQDDLKALIAGNFTSVNGTNRAGIVRLHANGTIDASFLPQARAGSQILNVLQMGLQPDGRLVGGYEGVFRLNRDGSLDTAFNPGIGPLNALTVQKDGKFLISDEYYDRGADAFKSEVLRFLADGTIDSNFGPPELNDWVITMAVQPDAKVIIGGYFTLANGAPQNGIARLNGDGTLDASFDIGAGIQGANAALYALALQPDGKILAGGSFVNVNNLLRRNLVRLNADGSVDSSFDTGSGLNNFVDAIAVQADGKLLVGGGFLSVNGVPRAGLARLNSDGSVDSRFEAKLEFLGPVLISSIALQPDGQILIGGLFTAVNGVTRLGLARLNGDAGLIQLSLAPRGPANQLRASLTSWPGNRYRIESSTDLVNWFPVSTNTATGFTLDFADPIPVATGHRFYRAALLSP